MSGLLSRSRDDAASTATSYVQRTLNEAVRSALEDADLQQARRQRRRGRISTLTGILLGTGIGYYLRGSDIDVSEAPEVGSEAVETVTEVAEEARSEPEPQKTGLRAALPKLVTIGAAVAGLYLVRRRSGSAREMVQDATQRTGGVGDRTSDVSERAGEQTEAVAGTAGERVEEVGESIGDAAEEAGEQAGQGIEESGESIGEAAEEADESEDEGF